MSPSGNYYFVTIYPSEELIEMPGSLALQAA
jgi:hypothetical protein